jgi:4-diphosphocytidyl-2-C-methyl-D-erythritol kinase
MPDGWSQIDRLAMRTITIRSFAKLNLTFEILDDLPGGYHRIRTLFQSIDLADTLTFRLIDIVPDEEFGVEIMDESATTPLQIPDAKFSFPLTDENLIAKAAKRFESESRCGVGRKLMVSVDKRIPIAAGMAGGSGNAAATIRAMQEFFPEHCSSHSGEQVASALGSDINFCLHGGTQVGTNRGEVLSPVSKTKKLAFLIVKPRSIAISTPWIFRQYDERLGKHGSNEFSIEGGANATGNGEAKNMVTANYTAACCESLANGSLEELGETFFNSFERICFEHYPQVQKLRDAMLAAGCLSAHITGSGPTLFGLLPSDNLDRYLAERFCKLAEQADERLDFDYWLCSSKATGLIVSSK